MQWKITQRQQNLRDLFLSDKKQQTLVVKFLWLPVEIKGTVKWLERAKMMCVPFYRITRRGTRYYWAPVRWGG